MGRNILKCPLDLWIYQEIIQKNRPDLIIETGSCFGGSALFLANMMDLCNIPGTIITIDIIDSGASSLNHSKIRFINSSSTSSGTINKISKEVQDHNNVMVILDSDHTKNHVLKELNMYSPMVTSGQYLIVEDTNINNNPVKPKFGPGPKEAVDEFMKSNNEFYIDNLCEKFFLTFNPGGFLKKK